MGTARLRHELERPVWQQIQLRRRYRAQRLFPGARRCWPWTSDFAVLIISISSLRVPYRRDGRPPMDEARRKGGALHCVRGRGPICPTCTMLPQYQSTIDHRQAPLHGVVFDILDAIAASDDDRFTRSAFPKF